LQYYLYNWRCPEMQPPRVGLVLLFATAAFAATGVDISSLYPSSDYSCLKSSGYSFAIPRGYQSTGKVDPNVCSTIKNAHAGGIQYVDVYIFPCPTCGSSGASQISAMVNGIASQGCSRTSSTQGPNQYGQIWLDIEGTQYWTSSASSNQAFFNSMVSECKALAIPCGVYSSASQWNPIFGSSFTGGASAGLPLWWANWNSNACGAAFSPFGGWTKYTMQQYVGDTTACGMSIDKDCY